MAWTKAAQAKYKRDSHRYESDLTDAEWARLEPLLPGPAATGRPREVDLREVVNAIQYQLTTGCQWRVTRLFSQGFHGSLLLLSVA